MDFSVLGPVRASIDGRPVDLGVRKQRFVLAMLLLEANTHVPADRLIDLAWPEGEAPDTARAVIHTQISRLRTSFAGSEDVTLVREGSGYQLRFDPMRVDVFRFRGLCARARAAADERRIEILEEALALWDGPALSSVATEDIRLRVAAPLEEARLGALEERFEAYLRLGRQAEIIHELAEAAAEHPLRQQLVAKLMAALHRLDRTPEALAAYRRLYQHLTEAIAMYRALGDVRWEAVSGRELGIVHQDEGNHEAAVELLTASRETLRDVSDGRREGATLRCLAWVALEAGNLPEVLAYARQARETLSRTRDTHGLAGTEVPLGDIHLALGDPEGADNCCELG